jgi:glycine/D-amino acid oxidase-like deaminating enzyme
MRPLFPKPLVPSLYAETARAPVATPSLAGDLNASVAIVGAGFTGLSAALHLSEAGIDVAVVDANEPGWGASGRNGGQVNPGFKHTPDEMEAGFGPDLGARMVALCGGAPREVFRLVERLGIDCEAAEPAPSAPSSRNASRARSRWPMSNGRGAGRRSNGWTAPV